MKFIAISDTHGCHNQLELPKGDVIIHAGDITKRGTENEVKDFLNWFSKLNYRFKIFIAGNHDFYFENTSTSVISELIPNNVIYLNDSFIEIEKIKIWGSPITPTFFNWAFNRDRGESIDRHWQLIPNDIDILITHGPIYGVLDKILNGTHVGCEMLARKIKNTSLKYHISGHIHESYGEKMVDDIHFINASVLNIRYALVNQPICFEYGFNE